MNNKIAAIVWVAAFATSSAALGQQGPGSLSGVVVGYDGMPVVEAPIRAIMPETDTDERAFTDANGRFTLNGLPPGRYTLSVTTTCCTYANYANDDVIVSSSGASEIDIRLQEGLTLSVIGDDPGLKNAELLARQAVANAPAPTAMNGHPDLSGVWLPRDDPFPEPARALPWAEELSQARRANQLRDLPGMRCLPNNVPPFYAGASRMSKFVQTPGLIIVLFEEAPGFRQIFLDGRDHPERTNPSWAGHSIGRWEGNTLVVDTVGFNSRGWTFTYPRTTMLRIEERYTRTEYGRMDVRVTITDPGVFEAPVVRSMTWDLAPQEEIIEYVCENNKWADAVGNP